MALDDRKTVIDRLEQQDDYVTMRAPWMLRAVDLSRLTLKASVLWKVDGLGVRFGYRSQTWLFDDGTPMATTTPSHLYGAEGRRMDDCPSEFRFMTLREIWQSIFQWGF